MNFSMKTRSSPNDALASAFASPKPSATSRGRMRDPHPLAAAAGGGLDHHGIADLVGDLHRVLFVLDDAEDSPARWRRWPLAAAFLDSILSPIAAMAPALGPMKTMPAFRQRARKSLALGQESIAGMHGLGAGLAAGLDDLVDHQIAFGGRRRPDQNGLIGHFDVQRVAVGLGIDRDRLDPHAAGGLDDPAGDLAAIGDQNSFEHGLVCLQPLGGVHSRRNLACGGGRNNSVVQQNGAEATVLARYLRCYFPRQPCRQRRTMPEGLRTHEIRLICDKGGQALPNCGPSMICSHPDSRHCSRRARAGPPAPIVRDGSTLQLADVTYRLDGIDAPALDQMCIDEHADAWACGVEARDQLSQPDWRPPGPLRGSGCRCPLQETAYRHLHR